MGIEQEYMQIPISQTKEEKLAYENWYNYYKECELFDISIGIVGMDMTHNQRRLSNKNAIKVAKKYNISYFNHKNFQNIKYEALRDVENELKPQNNRRNYE